MSLSENHDGIAFRASAIHGMGGFATRELAAGERIIEYLGERIDKHESHRRCEADNPFIFELDDVWDIDGGVDWNPARWINHSCNPNAETQILDGRIWVVALRTIQAGEEITFNYNYGLEDYREHPCGCGASACVGYIVAEEHFEHVRRQAALRTAGAALLAHEEQDLVAARPPFRLDGRVTDAQIALPSALKP